MFKNTTLIAVAIGAVFASSALQAETVDTRIGKLEFTHDWIERLSDRRYGDEALRRA